MLIFAGQYLFPNGVYVQASKFKIYAFCGLKIPFTAFFCSKICVYREKALLLRSKSVLACRKSLLGYSMYGS